MLRAAAGPQAVTACFVFVQTSSGTCTTDLGARPLHVRVRQALVGRLHTAMAAATPTTTTPTRGLAPRTQGLDEVQTCAPALAAGDALVLVPALQKLMAGYGHICRAVEHCADDCRAQQSWRCAVPRRHAGLCARRGPHRRQCGRLAVAEQQSRGEMLRRDACAAPMLDLPGSLEDAVVVNMQQSQVQQVCLHIAIA